MPLDEHNRWYIHTFCTSMSQIADTFTRFNACLLKPLIFHCTFALFSITSKTLIFAWVFDFWSNIAFSKRWYCRTFFAPRSPKYGYIRTFSISLFHSSTKPSEIADTFALFTRTPNFDNRKSANTLTHSRFLMRLWFFDHLPSGLRRTRKNPSEIIDFDFCNTQKLTTSHAKSPPWPNLLFEAPEPGIHLCCFPTVMILLLFFSKGNPNAFSC